MAAARWRAGVGAMFIVCLDCRSVRLVVEVEFVEAKGPHCVFHRHRAGHVTRLGVPESLVAETGEPLI